MRAARAESLDRNEHAIDDGAERSEQIDRHEDHQMKRSWPSSGIRRSNPARRRLPKSLEGTWLPEQLATVERQLVDWDHGQKQIAAGDKDLAVLLQEQPFGGSEGSAVRGTGGGGDQQAAAKEGIEEPTGLRHSGGVEAGGGRRSDPDGWHQGDDGPNAGR